MEKTDTTHFAILISYLAMRAGLTPAQLAEVMPPSKSQDTKDAVEFWNTMLECKKVKPKKDYAG